MKKRTKRNNRRPRKGKGAGTLNNKTRKGQKIIRQGGRVL